MAREICRTVAPAKVSPCQSAENDCTRLNASSVISFMVRAASGFQNRTAVLRTTENAR